MSPGRCVDAGPPGHDPVCVSAVLPATLYPAQWMHSKQKTAGTHPHDNTTVTVTGAVTCEH